MAGEARSPSAVKGAEILTNISKNPGVIKGAEYYELKEILLSSEQDLKRQRIRVINPSARVGEKREFGSERPIVICYDLGNRYRCQKSSTR